MSEFGLSPPKTDRLNPKVPSLVKLAIPSGNGLPSRTARSRALSIVRRKAHMAGHCGKQKVSRLMP